MCACVCGSIFSMPKKYKWRREAGKGTDTHSHNVDEVIVGSQLIQHEYLINCKQITTALSCASVSVHTLFTDFLVNAGVTLPLRPRNVRSKRVTDSKQVFESMPGQNFKWCIVPDERNAVSRDAGPSSRLHPSHAKI